MKLFLKSIALTGLFFVISVSSMSKNPEFFRAKQTLIERARSGNRQALHAEVTRLSLPLSQEILTDFLFEQYAPAVSAQPIAKQPEVGRKEGNNIVAAYGYHRGEDLKLFASDELINKILTQVSAKLGKRIALTPNKNDLAQADTLILFFDTEGRTADNLPTIVRQLELAKNAHNKVVVNLATAFQKGSQAEQAALKLGPVSRGIQETLSQPGQKVSTFFFVRDGLKDELSDIASNDQQMQALVAALKK